MNTKIRSLVLAALVLALSAFALSSVSAQDATSTVEPTAETTAEPSMPSTMEAPAEAHAFLGIAIQDTSQGVYVAQLAPGSPAEEAGLQVGDVITSLNANDVANSQDVANTIRSMDPGAQVNIDFMRDGDKMSVTVTLGTQTADMQMPTPAMPMMPEMTDQPNGNNNNGSNNRNHNNRQFGLSYNGSDQTWMITNLSDNSPLYDAGLREGDVITAIDGSKYDAAGLREYINSLDADAMVTLSVQRNGAAQEIQIAAADLMRLVAPMTMGRGNGNQPGNGNDNLPDNFFQMMPPSMFGYGNGRLGVTFVTLDEQTALQYGVTMTEGALIVSVDANSPASESGLQENDIVTAVNGEPVDQERTLRDRLIAYEPGDVVTLTVLREGQSQDIEATMGEPDVSSQNFRGFQFQAPNVPGMPEMPTPEVTEAPNM